MARIRVRVTPRAGKDRLELLPDGSLRAHLTAPPVDGRANEALERLLARALGVPPRDVAVVRGATAREKFIEVAGLDDTTVFERLRVAGSGQRGQGSGKRGGHGGPPLHRR